MQTPFRTDWLRDKRTCSRATCHFGWRHLSNATCPTRSRSFCVFFVVSRTTINLLHYSSLLKKTCVRQVVLDKWLPLGIACCNLCLWVYHISDVKFRGYLCAVLYFHVAYYSTTNQYDTTHRLWVSVSVVCWARRLSSGEDSNGGAESWREARCSTACCSTVHDIMS